MLVCLFRVKWSWGPFCLFPFSKQKPLFRMFFSPYPAHLKLAFVFYRFYWLWWVFAAAHHFLLVGVSWGHSWLQCVGFSLWWCLLLWSIVSIALRPVGPSWTRDQTGVPCIAKLILNHWATKEALFGVLISVVVYIHSCSFHLFLLGFLLVLWRLILLSASI